MVIRFPHVSVFESIHIFIAMSGKGSQWRGGASFITVPQFMTTPEIDFTL